MELLSEINNTVSSALKEGVDLVWHGKAAASIQIDNVDSFHINFASAMRQLEIRVSSVDDGVDLTHPNVYRHMLSALTTFFTNMKVDYFVKISMLSSDGSLKKDTMARIMFPVLQKMGTGWKRDSRAEDEKTVTFIRQG